MAAILAEQMPGQFWETIRLADLLVIDVKNTS